MKSMILLFWIGQLNEIFILGNLIVTPKNSVVAVGSKATLHCSTDVNVYKVGPPNWEHRPVGEKRKYFIFESFYIRKHAIAMNESIGQYDLVISKTEWSDAGTYYCHDEAGAGKQRVEAELIVIDSSPKCSSNISSDGALGNNDCNLKPDYMQFNCSVHFQGNIPPVMEWRQKTNNDLNDSINSGKSDQTISNVTISSIVLKSSVALHGTYLVCQIKSGIQDGDYSCRSTVTNVQYALNKSQSYKVTTQDEPIRCSVDTNSQRCYYRWISVNDSYATETINHQIINLNGITTNRKYQCLADCELAGRFCIVKGQLIEVAIQLPEADSQDNSRIIKIIILVIFAILVLVLIVVSVYIWIYKPKLRKRIMQNMSCRKKKKVPTATLR